MAHCCEDKACEVTLLRERHRYVLKLVLAVNAAMFTLEAVFGVLSYDTTTQAELLARLAKNWPKLMLLAGGMLSLLAIRVRRYRKTDPLLLAYQEFLEQMAQRGLRKRPSETPYAFAQRVATQIPTKEAEQVFLLTEAFMRARYAHSDPLAIAQAIRRRLKRGIL
jgi:hypothetical protein